MPAEDKWANDGTECLRMQLVRAAEDSESFAPEFVYPLVGEAQIFYGYKDLDIRLSFASGSLRSCLDISYAQKMPGTSSVKPDDIEGIFFNWLPADYTKDTTAFSRLVQEDERTFSPYGTRIACYARRVASLAANGTDKGKGKATIAAQSDDDEDSDARVRWEDCSPDDDGAVVYEAWHATMDVPGFREYLRRMQIFVPLYIEGGEYIDEEDSRWEFVVLYERQQHSDRPSYHFVGYCDLYPYLYWPHSTRMRLAQFIILPPFQGAGHGSRFYSTVYLWLLSRPEVAEMTVEDPSEAFQDLRDKADLNALFSKDVIKGIVAPVDRGWAEEVRKEMKLADRQFARLLEMALLPLLDGKDRSRARAYRLMVKERLYRFNYDVLAQMEKTERRDLLRDTFEGVLTDYRRLTEPFRIVSSTM